MRAEARHGTATSGCPLRVVRMRLVANGVRVMTVLRPAWRHIKMYECAAQAFSAWGALHRTMMACRVDLMLIERNLPSSYGLHGPLTIQRLCCSNTRAFIAAGSTAPDDSHQNST